MSRHDNMIALEAAASQEWDVVIVGGGMGGASAAYALVRAGHRVLLLEKGLADFAAAAGVEVEQEDPRERLQNGKWPTQLSARVDGALSHIWAPLGCGLGGSSLLYAAALQRLDPRDFDPHTTPDGRTIEWPFSYGELEPYYQQAEQLFAVRGTVDPLETGPTYRLAPPPAMCERDRHYFQVFKEAGLHPYRLHVAMEYQPDCGECGGHVCPRSCKRDARNSGVLPALASGRLFVASEAEVVALEADERSVTAVRVARGEQQFLIRGKVVALAAGAYFTPAILQKSACDLWPAGLANRSGLVGKNLMFHASDFIAFWPRQKCSRVGPNKTIALRDFYRVDGAKLGEFQSTGLAAGYGIVLYALRLLFDQSRLRKLPLARQLLRIPAYIAAKLYGEATVFTTIVEDYPYEENRVVLDATSPSGMRFDYTIHDEFRTRVATMKRAVRKKLSRLRSIPMNIGVSLNYGHPCGTCKAGGDPRTSVVDRDCKAHDLDNLYIVDASFMPTSGGTNPSLTIAANALRVAEAIDKKLRPSTQLA